MKILFTIFALAVSTGVASAQLFLTTSIGQKVGAYDPVTGATINANLITGLGNPEAINAFGGALYVESQSAGSIGTYALDGSPISASFLTGVHGKMSIFGSDLFVFTFANTLGKFTPAGATVNNSFINTLNQPGSIARSGNTLYIGNTGTNSVGTYRADTGAVINASFITGLNEPIALALFGNTLYVSNFNTDTIGSYNATTGATINAALIPGLNDPVDIKIFGGFVYVANRNGGTIGKYNLDGTAVNAALISNVGPNGVAVAFDKSTAIDLGVISSTMSDYTTPDRTTIVSVPAARQVIWYKFTIAENADAVSTRFLDISTRPISPSRLLNNDTEIGIYNADGTRLATNDDFGIENYSQLSFSPSAAPRGPLTVGEFVTTSEPATGQDGSLPAGTYYLAVSVFDATFLDSEFDVASGATNTGTFHLDFRTDIPAPPGSAPILKLTNSTFRPTTESRVTLRGTTADVNGGVPGVFVKVNRSKFIRARGGLKWSFRAKLVSGRNLVQIYAIDAGGLRSPVRRKAITRRP